MHQQCKFGDDRSANGTDKTYISIFCDDLGYKSSKVGQGFNVQSGFISRSVHARLQVFVSSSYNFCQPG